ncbi:MAG: HAMP domain-containing protein [Deltaproteobacteria bacterium]|nr:MAG: HAMP domain-containing protein [Deltaproteobacteria bacterium]
MRSLQLRFCVLVASLLLGAVSALTLTALRSERAALEAATAPLREAAGGLDPRPGVEAALRSSLVQLSLTALLAVGLGSLVAARVAGGFARPLRRLRAGVEHLRAGDLSVRVPPTSNDEIGELTRAFNRMGESLQQQERMRVAFGRYVNDYVVAHSLESPEACVLGGAEREVTIVFVDIRNFTRLSEGMKAQDVVALLNEVFQLASEPLLARGGTIDKFMGDSVMAYFGAPTPAPDHAERAVSAAIDIQRSMASARSRGGHASSVELGIGIHSGTVVVGDIGSDARVDFTAIGDAVNVAHRVEKLAPPGAILISEAVQRRVRGAFGLRFEGERLLSGRQEPVHVYSVDLDALGADPGPDRGAPTR